MTDVTIYHNPRCSKSRQTLEIIEDKDISPEIKLYLETPPSQAELEYILKKLDLPARSLMRIKEDAYTANNLDNESLSEQELIAAMIRFPKLIERPIVLANSKAVIGRPPENVLSIL
jgi:arsenate reductase